MGVGTGAGVEGGTHAQRGGGEAQRRRPTGRHRTIQQYIIVYSVYTTVDMKAANTTVLSESLTVFVLYRGLQRDVVYLC
jgi:hypothetical protein